MVANDDGELDARVGEEIRHLRLHRNWSMTDLGNAVGSTQAQVQAFETGRSTLTVRKLVAIADALEVDPSHLLRVRPGRIVADPKSFGPEKGNFGLVSAEDIELAAKIARIRDDAARRDIIASIDRLAGAIMRNAGEPAGPAL